LSQINAIQLSNNLKSLLNESPLTNNTFLFSGRRYVEKISMERERVSILVDILDHAISINKKIVDYTVDTFLTQQKLEYYITKFQIDIEIEARALARAEELMAKQHIDNLDRVIDEGLLRKEELRAAKVANDKVVAEIDQMRAATRITNSQGDLLDRIKTELNLSNITSSQAFVLVKALDPKASADTDFAAREAMMNAEIDRMKAETAKAKTQVAQEEEKTEHQKFKNKRERDRPRE